MANWIHPAVTAFELAKTSVGFESEEDKEILERIIELWTKADQSRNKPRELLRCFGEGFALFCGLPEYIRGTSCGVWARNALIEAMLVADQNKIRVTFDITGPIFS